MHHHRNCIAYTLLLLSVSGIAVRASVTINPDPEEEVVKRVVKECTESTARVACFAEKAAKALNKAMSWDVPLFEGIELRRNTESLTLPSYQGRSLHQQSGLDLLVTSLHEFLKTHTLTIDLTAGDEDVEEGREGGGGGGGGDRRKGLRREKKYMQYAFMVLLGIFGLTGPLVMKTLAIMAAKALIASKIALIIVGSVALKKIFEKDHHEKAVKVHTINADDDHDRLFDAASPQASAYWAYEPWVKPST